MDLSVRIRSTAQEMSGQIGRKTMKGYSIVLDTGTRLRYSSIKVR